MGTLCKLRTEAGRNNSLSLAERCVNYYFKKLPQSCKRHRESQRTEINKSAVRVAVEKYVVQKGWGDTQNSENKQNI